MTVKGSLEHHVENNRCIFSLRLCKLSFPNQMWTFQIYSHVLFWLLHLPCLFSHQVINWRETLKIPRIAKLSPEAEKLILELCTNAEERLGAHQIKHHPFLKSVDFTKNIRDAEAPYKPTIRFPTDTSNFDPVSPDKLRGSSSSWGSSESNGNHKNHKSKGNHRQTEHAFFEFTFRRFFDDGGHPYSTPMRMNFDFPPQTPINREDLEAETTKASEPQEPVYV